MNIRIAMGHESLRICRNGRFFPETSEKITMLAARRDFGCAGVFVHADGDLLLSVGGEAFTPQGAWPTLRFALDCPLPGQIALVGLMPSDDDLPVAEIELEQEAAEAVARQTHQLLVKVEVPEDTAPGVYQGRVLAYLHETFGAERLYTVLPFEVQVHDVLLPKATERRFHLDLWQHWSILAQHGEVKRFSDAHFALIDEYMDNLALLGQKALTVIASEAPWSGQRLYTRAVGELANLFEYSCISVIRGRDGLRYDYSAMDRLIRMGIDHGIADEIEVFGLINIWQAEEYGFGQPSDYPDGIRIRVLEEETGCYDYLRTKEELMAYQSALQAHFEAKGWLDRVRIVADEPGDLELFRASLDTLNVSMGRCRKKAALNHVEFIEEFADKIDDYVPAVRFVASEWDALQRLRPTIAGRLLWYVCCSPDQPNTFVASPLLESRLVGLITAFMGYDGFLRWAYCCWPRRPRQSVKMSYPGWKSGDFGFVYPNGNGKPLNSLRWYQLRRGLDDDELIRMARDKGIDPAPLLLPLFPESDPRKWQFSAKDEPFYSLEPEAYDTFRRGLLEALEK